DVRFTFEHANRQHQKARCAEAALQAMIIHEGLLHRVEFVAIGKPFDGTDFSSIRLYGKHQAGAYGFAVDDDRACAADPVLAANVRAGLSAIFTDCIDQRAARLNSDRMIAAVDGECDVGLVAHSVSHPLIPSFSLTAKRHGCAAVW